MLQLMGKLVSNDERTFEKKNGETTTFRTSYIVADSGGAPYACQVWDDETWARCVELEGAEVVATVRPSATVYRNSPELRLAVDSIEAAKPARAAAAPKA